MSDVHVEDLVQYGVQYGKATLNTTVQYIVHEGGGSSFRIQQDNQNPDLPPDVVIIDREMLRYIVERTQVQ